MSGTPQPERWIARFAYEADDEKSISLMENITVVVVVNKNMGAEMEGWWQGYE